MPIHFLWGSEDYLIEQETRKIKEKILKDGISPFNYKKATNPSFALFLELLETNSLMFGDMVIEIICPNYFFESKTKKDEESSEKSDTKQKLDDKQTQELINALNNLSESIHLILICPVPRGEKKKPDSRKKLYKEILKLTQPKELNLFMSYETNKIAPYVKEMAEELELKIDDKTIVFLIQVTGTSLRDISTQLEKLKLYTYPENIVTKEIINKVVSSVSDIYTLTDLILKNDFIGAINLICDLLQKQYHLALLGFMQSSIGKLLKIKIYENVSNFELSKKLNMHEYIILKEKERIKKISLKKLLRLKINLTEAEYNLKSGIITNPLLAFETAFMKGYEND